MACTIWAACLALLKHHKTQEIYNMTHLWCFEFSPWRDGYERGYGERGRDCDKLYKVTARLQPWMLKNWNRTIESSLSSLHITKTWAWLQRYTWPLREGHTDSWKPYVCHRDVLLDGWIMDALWQLSALDQSSFRKCITQKIMNMWVNENKV